MKPPMRVAIIDDNQVYRFIAKKLIQRAAPWATLIELHDGQQAIDFMLPRRDQPSELPGLILLDINMPNLNGWQFLDELRKIRIATYRPTIYIVSSSNSPEDIDAAATYPEIKGYLTKPLQMTVIEGLLAEL
ncbi:response regulator [Salmonirosea aquatica]